MAMDKEQLRSLSFELGYARLAEVIQKLENGDLTLDESVELYEEGMEIAEHCGQQLDDVELKVTELLSRAAEQMGGALA